MIASKSTLECAVTHVVTLAIMIFCPVSRAAQTQPLGITHLWPGGLDPRPFITFITATQEVTLRWSGYGGPYQVEQRATAASGNWTGVGGPTSDNSLMFPANGDVAFFRVQGPPPNYVGAETCLDCHPNTHVQWLGTAHSAAFRTLKEISQHTNPDCLACHTVGFGLAGGFVDEATTPQLANVQCENCHGPAGAHAQDPANLSKRPSITLSAMLCGGCHNRIHHATYDEWTTAGHSQVTPTPAGYFLSTNVATAEARMLACGPCHSGAVRLTLLKGALAVPPQPNPPLPSGLEAATTPVMCSVCHTAHEKTANGAQLRNPPYSTNFFSYSTSTNTTFAAQYNANINVCGQCHNERGARWQDTARPPHHSPQYNILVGAVGFETGAPENSSHRNIAKQCSQCHTHPHEVSEPSEDFPNHTGHAFTPLTVNCTPCHEPEQAESLIAGTQSDIKGRITAVKTLLDTWSTTKAPEPLRTQYGALAWEFTSAGQLSSPPGTPPRSGPTTSEQTLVPDNIKQARFYVYLVEHDGSYGVHNAKYARHLLKAAEDKVKAEMGP